MIKKAYRFNDKPLKTLTSTDVPSYFIFFDTETEPHNDGITETHEFKIAWSCFWDRKAYKKEDEYDWKFWDDSEEMCKYFNRVAQELGKVILVGHNIYFDLQVCGFFSFFAKKKWKLQFIYDHQSCFILKIKLNQDVVVCLSSTNWFDQSLKEIGKLVGLKKLDIDLEKASDEELKIYCKRDVEILTKILAYYIDFIKIHELGKFSFSKASQSFNAYRYRFMNDKIRIHTDEKTVNLERSAYMGGRCECFFIGQVKGKSFVTLDINSMYPYVMSKYEYPCQLVEYVENPSIERIQRVLKRFCVVTEVDIETKEPAFAVVYNKKTVFPVGKFTCFLCTEGLKYALYKGYVKSIKKCSIYLKGDLFTEYVKYLYPLKNSYKVKGDKIMEKLTKYFLNSLYGKWGQKYQLEKRTDLKSGHEYYREEILDLRTKRLVIHTWLMNQKIVRYGETEGKNSLVAIVAHITENSRLLLWDVIKTTGRQRVFYCDTDSIKIKQCDLKYVKHKLDENEIGCLKVEDIYKSLFIGGNKYYITEKNRKIKGIPKDAIEVEPGVYEFYSWPKMTYHLRQGVIKGYHRKKVKRRVSLKYDKGIVLPSGKVKPFTFPLPG